jgi:poly(3-hydroxybutyrate) depolymerase
MWNIGRHGRFHDWAADWALRNGCVAGPDVTFARDGVAVDTWTDCMEGVTVILYSMEGWGHGWPKRGAPNVGVDATEVIWAFFEGRRLH